MLTSVNVIKAATPNFLNKLASNAEHHPSRRLSALGHASIKKYISNNLNKFSAYCFFSGVSGVHCEELSYGFEEMSFVEFPPLDRRTNLIYFEFATVQRDSLLLYNPGTLSSREFFALEILDGTVQLSYDLGSGTVKLQTLKQVADGRFHSVTVRRIGNVSFNNVNNVDQ